MSQLHLRKNYIKSLLQANLFFFLLILTKMALGKYTSISDWKILLIPELQAFHYFYKVRKAFNLTSGKYWPKCYKNVTAVKVHQQWKNTKICMGSVKIKIFCDVRVRKVKYFSFIKVRKHVFRMKYKSFVYLGLKKFVQSKN